MSMSLMYKERLTIVDFIEDTGSVEIIGKADILGVHFYVQAKR